MNNRTVKKNTGYALLETVFYILLFAFLSIAVINSLITMTRAYKESAINNQLMNSSNVVEKISRELRKATSISVIDPELVKVNSKDDDGNPETVEFSLLGSDLIMKVNDVPLGQINSESISIDSVSFSQVTMSSGEAIRVMLTVSAISDNENRQLNFYDTIVLRGTY